MSEMTRFEMIGNISHVSTFRQILDMEISRIIRGKRVVLFICTTQTAWYLAGYCDLD